MVEWTVEEKVLLNIRQVIAAGWRMNSRQLCGYWDKLYRNQEKLMPGQLGREFLDILSHISTEKNDIRWADLMKDAGRLQELIQEHQEWDEETWLKFLPRLEAHQDTYFQTQLGTAFVQTLKEKLHLIGTPDDSAHKDMQKDILQKDIFQKDIFPEDIFQKDTARKDTAGKDTAKKNTLQGDAPQKKFHNIMQAPVPPQNVQPAKTAEDSSQDGFSIHAGSIDEMDDLTEWLMADAGPAGEKRKQKKRFPRRRFPQLLERAAISIFACLSLCFMVLWLRTQIERNLNKWNVQQMKVTAHKKENALTKEGAETNGNAGTYLANLTDAGVSKKSGRSEAGQDNQAAAQGNGQESRQDNQAAAQRNGTGGTPQESMPEILPQYQEMVETYPQLYGWLEIPDTEIDLPVMQPQEERDFYLEHDFTGADTVEGTLFVDRESRSWPQDDNTVIYGHNMKNGHIFGMLNMYREQDFFDAHKEIRFDTLYETGVYEAAAVLKTRILNENETGFRYYQFFNYETEAEFQECLDFIKENQLFETGDTLRYGDTLLMLSTCEYSQENGRLVVAARKR